MSRLCIYEQFSGIVIKDYKGLKNFLKNNEFFEDLVIIDKNESEESQEQKEINGKIIKTFSVEYDLSLGMRGDDESRDSSINYFHPESMSKKESEAITEADVDEENPTAFLICLSRYLEDFDCIIWDEEFPSFPTQNGEAFRLKNTNGVLVITEIKLVEVK